MRGSAETNLRSWQLHCCYQEPPYNDARLPFAFPALSYDKGINVLPVDNLSNLIVFHTLSSPSQRVTGAWRVN